jgi:hypothetical protein
VKLYSRPGDDLTHRFPLIVEAIAKLRSRSCIIDGEAVACGEDGIASLVGFDTAILGSPASPKRDRRNENPSAKPYHRQFLIMY